MRYRRPLLLFGWLLALCLLAFAPPLALTASAQDDPGAAGTPPVPPVPSGQAAFVEHWIGTGVVDGGGEYHGYQPGDDPEVVQGSVTIGYDLYVDATGQITGKLLVRWQAAISLQPGAQARCSVGVGGDGGLGGVDCSASLQPDSGQYILDVTGTRTRTPDGKIAFALRGPSNPDRVRRILAGTNPGYQSPPYRWTHTQPSRFYALLPPAEAMNFAGPPVQTYGRVLVEDTQQHMVNLTGERESWRFEVSIFEVGDAPLLRFDTELLKRSIFMNLVSVPNALTANVNWSAAGGGATAWRLPSGPVTTAISPQTVIPQTVDVGAIGTGKHDVTVRGTDTLGRATVEETVALVAAPFYSRCPSYSRSVQAGVVTYKCEVKVPDEPFNARIAAIPSIIPFFGGHPLGVEKAQIAGNLELKSTGEGALAGGVAAKFEAMGSSAPGTIGVKGELAVQPDGVRFTKGTLEIAVTGTLKKEQPLVTAIPALNVPLAALEKIAPPAAAYLRDIAKIVLEVQPKIAVPLNLENDPNPQVGWRFAPATPALGSDFKIYFSLDLLADKVQATGGVGGGAAITAQVPAAPEYLKEVELKFLTYATIKALLFERSVEQVWSYKYPSSLAASAADAVTDADAGVTQLVTAVDPGWTLRDRSYLAEPGYAQWVGQFGPPGPLVAKVGPDAHPAYRAADIWRSYLIWSHERPDAPADSAAEIAWANLSPRDDYRPSSGYVLMTNDDRQDLNPQLAYWEPWPMVVWERFDTPTPGNFAADPQGYLSHMQVAASLFDANSATPSLAPVQLSTSGSLNHRPQIAKGNSYYPFIAVWINNAANLLQGTGAQPDRFVFSVYQRYAPGGWTPPAVIQAPVPGIQSFALAYRGDGLPLVSLVFSADSDGNPQTLDDVEVYLTELLLPGYNQPFVWSPVERLTNNAVGEQDVQAIWAPYGPYDEYIDPIIRHVVWRAGDQVFHRRGSEPAQALPFTRPSDAGPLRLAVASGSDKDPALLQLQWPQGMGIASTHLLHTSLAWSAPHFTPAPGADGAQAVVEVLGAEGVAQVATLGTVTRTVGSDQFAVPVVVRRDLVKLAPDAIRPISITVEPSSLQIMGVNGQPPVLGGPLTLVATLRNHGDAPADNVQVAVIRRAGGTAGTYLASVTVTVPSQGVLPVQVALPPQPPAPTEWYELHIIRTVCDYLCDTSFFARQQLPADAVAVGGGASEYGQDVAIARLYVSQAGPLPHAVPMTATVRAGLSGPLLAQVGVLLPTTPTEVVTATAPISVALLGPGQHILWWEVAANGAVADPNPFNNAANSLIVVAPDLRINPYFTHMAGSEVLARVENAGNWSSLATTLEVWSAPPAAAGAVRLGVVAVPPLAPGATVDLHAVVAAAVVAAGSTTTDPAYLVLDPGNQVAEIDENTNLVAFNSAAGGAGAPGMRLFLPSVRK